VRAEWHDFSKGLWSVGGKEHTMPGFVRRAKGLHSIRTPHLQSRDGSELLFSLDAHSLYRFADQRIQAADAVVYLNGAVVDSGHDGSRLRFVPLPPQPGLQDYLFITGGGRMIKMSPDGVVSLWGITEPSGPPSLAETNTGAGALTNGVYKYKIVFRNGITGSRSNAQLVESSITVGSGPSSVALTNIPVSTDAQVSEREVYRTQVDGAIYFRAFVISDNTTTSTTDNVADDDLETIQLQTDNNPPTPTWREAWVHDFQMWWCGDSAEGAQGRAYYAPVGRPESVLGFVEVSNTDDPTQVGFSWAETNWVMTEKNIYRIEGVSEPFQARKVGQCPGTTRPKTVTITPNGILYQAFDGIRLFNGNTSELVSFDQLGPIFRGQDLENLSAMTAIIGEYAKDEYFISDESQTLALNLTRGTWRDLGIGCRAFHCEQDTVAFVASFNFGVYSLEAYGETLDGADAIEIEWEPGGKLSDISQDTTLQRIYLDIDTGGQLLLPTLILDEEELELPTFLTNRRDLVEYSVGRVCRLVSIRLTGAVEARVKLYGLEMDLYMPGETPSQGRG
jgi:hypothetical protein